MLNAYKIQYAIYVIWRCYTIHVLVEGLFVADGAQTLSTSLCFCDEGAL